MRPQTPTRAPGGHGRALVIGYGLSGRTAATWLLRRGWQVVVAEDDPEVGHAAAGVLAGAGAGARPSPLTVEVAPGAARSADLARGSDLVVPSPGVPAGHPALSAASAAGVHVCSEIELAWTELGERRVAAGAGAAEQGRLVAITGTNGKTTVTALVTAMLAASGLAAVAAGNVGYPLLEAVGTYGGKPGTVIVAEVSSFQLEYTHEFRPDVSCWLNFAPDHLDWHPSLEHYACAKAKIWANQVAGSSVVINADDPAVSGAAATVPAGVEVVSFGTAGPAAGPHAATAGPLAGTGRRAGPDWLVTAEGVNGPGGFAIKAVDLPRAFPHDLANTAAALAVAIASGGNEAGCVEAARATAVPEHRVQLVGRRDGVAWYDDSKATTPAAVQAGVRAFPSVILIAGGRNKGLDLSDLAVAVPPVRAVVAIGESAAEVASAFAGAVPVRHAGSMADAVAIAGQLAVPGDAVVLSPGCASFDWYTSYAQRGEHFAALVRARLDEEAHL